MASNRTNGQRTHRHLQQVVAGLNDGVILIRPDGTIFSANEAALALHGVRTPAELGATVADYQSRFRVLSRSERRLPPGEDPMGRLLSFQPFGDTIVQVAPAGRSAPRWLHKTRGLVLTDRAGRPDCLALILDDVTEELGATERFERAFNANPAPATILRISDLRYVKVNQGFLDMTGWEREDVVGRTLYELDVLRSAEQRELGIEHLRRHRTIPQMEAEIEVPGGAKSVVVAGQPIELGDERCMLFTFMDLDPRKRMEHALRHSEERFSKAFRLTPVPTMICTLHGMRILEVNDAFVERLGHGAEHAVGRTPAELGLWVAADDRRGFEQALLRGGVRGFEVLVRTGTGETLHCAISGETVTINGEECALGVLHDITERKRSEAELLAAIESVMQDASWFGRTVVEKLAHIRGAGAPDAGGGARLADLTPREQEVLAHMCGGASDEQIARALGVSRHTVRNHVSTIYGKIDVHRRSSAIIWGRERGIDGQRAATREQAQHKAAKRGSAKGRI